MYFTAIINFIGSIIDLTGVLAIVLGIVLSLLHFCTEYFRTLSLSSSYSVLRQNLGRTIIIGLELLIAGDIIRSIAVPLSFTNVAVLAIIVLIRAFLSIQIENGSGVRFPWNHH